MLDITKLQSLDADKLEICCLGRLLIYALLIISVVSVVSFFVYLRKKKKNSHIDSKSMATLSTTVVLSVCVLTAVWSLRFAVGSFVVMTDKSLNFFEEFANSLLHTLQTFSLDEGYAEYILAGKIMLEKLFGCWHLQMLYGVYASALNVAAPVAGGALIFEILSSLFPVFRVWRICKFSSKEKIYFSELNDASVALAKSIRQKKDDESLRSAAIIFTDAYKDSESETSSELYMSAKALGAICIKDDIVHVVKSKKGIRRYFLIDENEAANLKALTNLVNVGNCDYLMPSSDLSVKKILKSPVEAKKAEIYLFSQSDAYVQIEHNAKAILRSKGFEENTIPEIFPIQKYRNMISRMLVDIPLYEPLIGRKKNKNGEYDLNVVILGAGVTSVEMFLSTYWFSQMLNVKTTISIIAKETKSEFKDKIDTINPEILRTIEIKDEPKEEKDPILKFNDTSYSDPYCYLNYKECDVYSSDFVELMGENTIVNADYVFVALGSDERNISTANSICRYVGEQHVCQKTDDHRKTIITYVVYDSDLARTLNFQKKRCFTGEASDIYMKAVGDLDDMYNWDNILLTSPKYDKKSKIFEKGYSRLNEKNEEALKLLNLETDYKYWANISRAMHDKYKLFSIVDFARGTMPSVTEAETPEEIEAYENDIERKASEYKQKLLIGGERENESGRIKILHMLAWVEHRRWNAFTRIKGFRSADKSMYDKYIGKVNSYKHFELKLHPCLLECDKEGIRVSSDESGCISCIPALLSSEKARDRLDDLSYDLNDMAVNTIDFKLYDYPIVYGALSSSVSLPEEWKGLIDPIAKATHESWREKCLAQIALHGDNGGRKEKADPRLVPYDELSEESKRDLKYDAESQCKLIYELGYSIKDINKIISKGETQTECTHQSQSIPVA